MTFGTLGSVLLRELISIDLAKVSGEMCTPVPKTTPSGSQWLPMAPSDSRRLIIHAVCGSQWLPMAPNDSHRMSLLLNHYPIRPCQSRDGGQIRGRREGLLGTEMLSRAR